MSCLITWLLELLFCSKFDFLKLAGAQDSRNKKFGIKPLTEQGERIRMILISAGYAGKQRTGSGVVVVGGNTSDPKDKPKQIHNPHRRQIFQESWS